MSNIGFMQNCTKYIEERFHYYMKNTKKSPTKQEKESYINLIEQLLIMKNHNEIEDLELFEVLYKKLKQCDLTMLTDFRRKLKKSGSLR